MGIQSSCRRRRSPDVLLRILAGVVSPRLVGRPVTGLSTLGKHWDYPVEPRDCNTDRLAKSLIPHKLL
jgi:hypothetical protein